jgi:hypothetical protein
VPKHFLLTSAVTWSMLAATAKRHCARLRRTAVCSRAARTVLFTICDRTKVASVSVHEVHTELAARRLRWWLAGLFRSDSLCSVGDDAGQWTESTAAKMSGTSLRVV